jgi:hypothetical protein
MLEFAEAVLHDIRQLKADANHIVLNGSMKTMEQYRHMMGRLEGLEFVERAVLDRLNKSGNQPQ